MERAGLAYSSHMSSDGFSKLPDRQERTSSPTSNQRSEAAEPSGCASGRRGRLRRSIARPPCKRHGLYLMLGPPWQPPLQRRLHRRDVGLCRALPDRSGPVRALADHECRPGRLPFDRTPACGCWPQEGAALLSLRRRTRPAPPLGGSRDAFNIYRGDNDSTATLFCSITREVDLRELPSGPTSHGSLGLDDDPSVYDATYDDPVLFRSGAELRKTRAERGRSDSRALAGVLLPGIREA